MISGYYCNECSTKRGILDHLKTGCVLATSAQSGWFKTHTLGRPEKGTNGVFFNTGTDFYQAGGRLIGQSGHVEIEIRGGVNAYFIFGSPIGGIEFSGIAAGGSSLGKAVLLNYPDSVHWFPATGQGSISGICSSCGQQLF